MHFLKRVAKSYSFIRKNCCEFICGFDPFRIDVVKVSPPFLLDSFCNSVKNSQDEHPASTALLQILAWMSSVYHQTNPDRTTRTDQTWLDQTIWKDLIGPDKTRLYPNGGWSGYLPNFIGEVDLQPLASPPSANPLLPYHLHSLCNDGETTFKIQRNCLETPISFSSSKVLYSRYGG